MRMTTYWLSFADDGFLGVVIVDAPEGSDIEDLVVELARRGLNPGGEVLCTRLLGVVPAHWKNRLLSTRAEAEAAMAAIEAPLQ
jgi:hypothetical protein